MVGPVESQKRPHDLEVVQPGKRICGRISFLWYRDGSWLELDMPLDLAPLADQAVPIAISVMDLAICGQQNLAEMRRHVAHTVQGVLNGVQ